MLGCEDFTDEVTALPSGWIDIRSNSVIMMTTHFTAPTGGCRAWKIETTCSDTWMNNGLRTRTTATSAMCLLKNGTIFLPFLPHIQRYLTFTRSRFTALSTAHLIATIIASTPLPHEPHTFTIALRLGIGRFNLYFICADVAESQLGDPGPRSGCSSRSQVRTYQSSVHWCFSRP